MILSDSQKQCLEQLAKEKGSTICFNCGSPHLGVHELASDWVLGDSYHVVLNVVLKCSDCNSVADNFIISPEEARRCGLDPEANLPGDVP
jgi:hypothetical protein